jgi:uncharacterized hydrophobic protein (TIGR00341 family)
MALRLLQVFLPDGPQADLESILEHHDVIGTWPDARGGARRVLCLLVQAEEAEPIMDRLDQAFGGREGFRVVLSATEAVAPRPEPPPEAPPVGPTATPPPQPTFGRVSREELFTRVSDDLDVNRVYIGLALLSSIVAAVGVMRDDVAVIIGAMVIAPLLGPNVAMALATTLGDMTLLRRAVTTNLVGVATGLGVAIALGLALGVDPMVPAIASRTHVGFGDLALALAAGSAGTLAFTRGLSGAVIGVMVAVALMPPLVVCGLLLGAGYLDRALSALLLVAANVICINLAGVAMFLAQGVRPRRWWEEDRARRARRLAIAIWAGLLVALALILYVRRSHLLGSA